MRALLDVNVLVALLDDDHSFHKAAVGWFDSHRTSGWASCPLTQNGFVRVAANARYPDHNTFSIADAIEQMTVLTEETDHEFWSDELSLFDESRFDNAYMLGPRQITDIYLLALAAHHNGQLVTFDQGISVPA